MTQVTATMDFWSLAWPRFVQGFSLGFIFVPLQALALATIRTERLGNATAAYNVVRNIGGSVGSRWPRRCWPGAASSTRPRSSATARLEPGLRRALADWTEHFLTQGADRSRRRGAAMAMLYRETVQAQVLSYADDFWLMLIIFCGVVVLIPFMRRVRARCHAHENRRRARRARPRAAGRRRVRDQRRETG